MSQSVHCHSRAAATRPSSTLLGTSLLVTRSPRHNRALAGLLRPPAGRVT